MHQLSGDHSGPGIAQMIKWNQRVVVVLIVAVVLIVMVVLVLVCAVHDTHVLAWRAACCYIRNHHRRRHRRPCVS